MRLCSSFSRSLCALACAVDTAPALSRVPALRPRVRPPPAHRAPPVQASAADPPSLCLVDGHSLAYRMNFALAKTGMSTRAAEPTHALHGFCTKLIDLEFRFPQHRMAVAFDLPGPTFRSLKLPSYKSGRPPMPGDLRSQIELIREACGLFGLPSLSEPSYEGDDILATCATAAAKAGFASVTIVTGDKDMLQLVTPDDAPTRVAIWDDRAKRVMDGEAVRAKFGVAPHQIADYLALTGDASDAVPGVPGVGPKGAAQLLAAHGDLDAVLAAAASMKKSKRREALLDHAEQARRSRMLVELCRDVPLDPALATGLPMSFKSDELERFLKRWELNQVAGKVRKLRKAQEQMEAGGGGA